MRPTKLNQQDRRNEPRPKRRPRPVTLPEWRTVDNEGWEARLAAQMDALDAQQGKKAQ